jgi:hypothetical protein
MESHEVLASWLFLFGALDLLDEAEVGVRAGAGIIGQRAELGFEAGDIFLERFDEALGVRGAEDDAGEEFALRDAGEEIDEIQGELVGVVMDDGEVGVVAQQFFFVGFDLDLLFGCVGHL